MGAGQVRGRAGGRGVAPVSPTSAYRSPAAAPRRLEPGTWVDVDVWCSSCRGFVRFSARVGGDGAARVTPVAQAAHLADVHHYTAEGALP